MVLMLMVWGDAVSPAVNCKVVTGSGVPASLLRFAVWTSSSPSNLGSAAKLIIPVNDAIRVS